MNVSFELLKSFNPLPTEYTKSDLAALAAFVLKSQKVKGEVELTLELTNPARIQTLNRRFRGVDRNTDVIAFRYPHPPTPLPYGARGNEDSPSPRLSVPLPVRERVAGGRVREDVGFDGDIAINIPQARLQAKKMRHPTKREVRLLLIHGILHLLGYTDYTPVPRRRMFKRQNELLRRWESR